MTLLCSSRSYNSDPPRTTGRMPSSFNLFHENHQIQLGSALSHHKTAIRDLMCIHWEIEMQNESVYEIDLWSSLYQVSRALQGIRQWTLARGLFVVFLIGILARRLRLENRLHSSEYSQA